MFIGVKAKEIYGVKLTWIQMFPAFYRVGLSVTFVFFKGFLLLPAIFRIIHFCTCFFLGDINIIPIYWIQLPHLALVISLNGIRLGICFNSSCQQCQILLLYKFSSWLSYNHMVLLGSSMLGYPKHSEGCNLIAKASAFLMSSLRSEICRDCEHISLSGS